MTIYCVACENNIRHAKLRPIPQILDFNPQTENGYGLQFHVFYGDMVERWRPKQCGETGVKHLQSWQSISSHQVKVRAVAHACMCTKTSLSLPMRGECVNAQEAVGPDGVPGQVLKAFAVQLARFCTDMFKLPLTRGPTNYASLPEALLCYSNCGLLSCHIHSHHSQVLWKTGVSQPEIQLAS